MNTDPEQLNLFKQPHKGMYFVGISVCTYQCRSMPRPLPQIQRGFDGSVALIRAKCLAKFALCLHSVIGGLNHLAIWDLTTLAFCKDTFDT